MKNYHSCKNKVIWVIIALLFSISQSADQADNTLTDAEIHFGWSLLFDGEDKMKNWQINMNGGPGSNSWIIEDAAMTARDGSGGSELFTMQPFDDFEFTMDWKINTGSNSGIWYRANPPRRICSCHEYSILDAENHPDKTAMGHLPGETGWPIKISGSNYDMYPTTVNGDGEIFATYDNPIGEYNRSVIVAKSSYIEHWINNHRVVKYVVGSADWEARYQESKYSSLSECANYRETWGRHPRGYIGIQDHGRGLKVWIKNLKIRAINPEEKVPTPHVTPAPGAFAAPVSVTLEAPISGAQILYTTNGSDPGIGSGTLYEGPITVSTTTTIKSITIREEFPSSDILTSQYDIPSGLERFSPLPRDKFHTFINNDVLTVTSLDSELNTFTIRISDHKGRRLLENVSTRTDFSLNLSDLPSGVLVLQVITLPASGQTGKIYHKLISWKSQVE